MNDGNEDSRELRRLVDRLLDGRISEVEVAALDAILKDNPAAQDSLLDYCQFHSVLMFDLHAERVIDRVAAVRHQTVAATPHVPRGSGNRPSKLMYAAMLAVAVTLLIVAATPWLMRPKALKFVPASSILARPEVASVKIESGTTELMLANIGSVVLQGPAEFEMLGPTRARLKYGRIKVRITDPRGHGFVVQMPNGEVTDLGTEFGVDVSEEGQNGLVVFEGSVDLRVPGSLANATGDHGDHVERLVEGDGVVVNRGGRVDRIMAIFTGRNATFGQLADSHATGSAPVIADVKDNLRTGETRKFYEIVPQGLNEDARSYVDRSRYEWKAVRADSMPKYLVGADYVKPFNNDKMRKDFELSVTLSRPARLFVIFDDRIPTPQWLSRDFKDTGDNIGLVLGPLAASVADANSPTQQVRPPGVQVDHEFSVWERTVTEAGAVALGPNSGESLLTAMYGIAAVALEPEQTPAGAAIKSTGHGLVPTQHLASLRLTSELFIQRR